MPFVVERGDEGGRLVLSGDVAVGDAAALREALMALAATPGPVTVDDTALGGYDASLLQLLIAFGRARGHRPVGATGGALTTRLAALGLPFGAR